MTHPCADCRRPATVGLGSTHLCQHCKWNVQAAILARRPELRRPDVGMGVPTGDGIEGGAPTLKCDTCKATWFGQPFMTCPWCEERPKLDAQIQEAMDASRIQELLERLREGDMGALGPAVALAPRVQGAQRSLARLLAQMKDEAA